MISRILLGERTRSILIVICWGILTASILSRAFYEKASLSFLDMTLLFAVNTLAGFILADVGQAVLGYFFSFGIGVSIFYLSATLPLEIGTGILAAALQAFWLVILLNQLIPVPVIVLLLGSIIGAALAERYL